MGFRLGCTPKVDTIARNYSCSSIAFLSPSTKPSAGAVPLCILGRFRTPGRSVEAQRRSFSCGRGGGGPASGGAGDGVDFFM